MKYYLVDISYVIYNRVVLKWREETDEMEALT